LDTPTAQQIVRRFGNAVAYLAVQTPKGDHQIGTAFHIGEGLFLTARHVLEDNRIDEVRIVKPVPVRANEFIPGLPDQYYRDWDAAIAEVMGQTPYYKKWLEPLAVSAGPFFPDDDRIDVAAFRVAGLHSAVPIVRLGIHWDDWVYRREWELSEAILLGYPPIPMSDAPELVAARAQIHTFVVPRHCPFVHFILSSTPRGGFSGGPALVEDGVALGIVTSGFVKNGDPLELGFQSVLSIEPIRNFLEAAGILPEQQKRAADELLGKPPPAAKQT
jgi:hypothetical protein